MRTLIQKALRLSLRQALPPSLPFSSRSALRNAGVLALLVSAGAAQAHTGHGTASLLEGLAHPLGADHLLAMVAVGLWSATALPAGKVWQGPATFMLALLVSAALGMAGFTLPFLEHMIALSVVLFGALLVLGRLQIPVTAGLGLVAAAASFHGLAHGAETPVWGFATYALGFLLTTAALHACGVAAGLGIRRNLVRQSTWLLAGVGSLLGGAGLYLAASV
jgi:urease accessory protein